MNDSLAPTVEQKKSRRGLMALVGAGGAAAVAALLGRSKGAEALVGDPLKLGEDNDAEGALTTLEASRSGRALVVRNISTLGGADGIEGRATADNGWGVYGQSSGSIGRGVRGYCSGASGIGVSGIGSRAGVEGSSANGIGVKGSSDSSVGVVGSSSVVAVSPPAARWGVLGAGDDIGVAGSSTGGTGVKGLGKPGVYGVCYREGGAGVRGDGEAPGSVGVFAKNAPGRQALRTEGQVQMNCARKVTLSNRANTVTLPTGVRAGSNAIVLAMVQGAPGNEAFVRRAFREDSTHIRITFNKKPANPTAVGYWVLHTG